MICPTCGHESLVAAKYCPECGSPLPAEAARTREERKVVTVLFCDLVGSTARAERADPEDVRAYLSSYHERVRAELERFGGTVEKFIGDAVMALFGAPVAHEDDPERAVRAALAIRDWSQQQPELQVRVGVTTGEALVSLDARPNAGEGMAAGDVVNTAARLQAAAPAGQILVDETTYRATHGVVKYRDANSVDAKGKAEPIRVWEALEARSRFGVDVRQESRVPLLGRERELEALVGALSRALAEHAPQLVTVVGVPGIGKSRLVWELFRHVDEQPELTFWRQGRSLPYGEGVSFWALSEIVKAHAGILDGEDARAASSKLRRAVFDVVTDARERTWVETHLRPLVGLVSEDVSLVRDEAFAAWRRFLEVLAEHSPLVLVFEDLQWADDGLLDFVDHLVEWVTDVPLLVVCTARPELLDRRPSWGGGKLNATTIALPPLRNDDVARLIAALLERPLLVAETQNALLERAAGNPLYAEQYARMLTEHVTEHDLPLPESVHGIIAARLDVLAAEEKRVVQDASVLGKVFWRGALASLGSSNGFELDRRLHSLERKEFVRRERRTSVEGEVEFAFRHVLMRDVAYGQIPRALRAEKHRRAAHWLESVGRHDEHAELIAHHYVSALEYARASGEDVEELRDRARYAARAAGDKAASVNAFPAAQQFYAQALDWWPMDDERPHLLLAYGRSRQQVDLGGTEALTAAVEGLLTLGDNAAAAEAEMLLGEASWQHGERDPAFSHFDRAASLAGTAAAAPSKARVLSTIARYRVLAGEPDAVELAQEALALGDELGLDDVRAQSRITIGTARGIAGDPRGAEDIEAGIAIAEAANSVESARGYVNLSSIRADWEGDVRARGLLEKALELSERFGQVHGVRWCKANLTGWMYAAGEWDEALDEIGSLLTEAAEPHYMDASMLQIRALIALARGDAEAAQLDIAAALERARLAKDAQALVPLLVEAARFALAAGDRARAQELIDEVDLEDTVRLAGFGADFFELVRGLSLERRLLELIEQTEPRSYWVDVAEMCLRGDWLAAAEAYAAVDNCVDEAYARLEGARKLIADGRLAEGNTELQRALGFYRSVGATRRIAEAESLLPASA
jgi:predicted ATPase/class 3 adenylate cyclase